EPVRAIMDSWIFRAGYPVVFVETTDDPATIALRQRRFLYDSAAWSADVPADETWAIPVTLRASAGGAVQQHRILLDGAKATFTFDAPVDWIVVNDGAWGFYRVRYARDLWQWIKDVGLATVFSPLERLELLVDTWAAVVAGLADLDEWVEVVRAAVTDDDPDVWSAVYSVFALLKLIADDDDRRALDGFIAEVAGPVWDDLGWDPAPGESRRSATARARVLSVLGLLEGETPLKSEAADRFRSFLEDQVTLAPDVVAAAARIAVSVGGEAGWSSVLEHYRSATLPQDKLRYLYALAETDYEPLVRRTLGMCLTPEIRTQDA